MIPTSKSDHDPILLNLLKVEISHRKFRFRFENIWLREPNFVAEVKDFWKTIPPVHLLPKLFEVSSYMARWGRDFFHKFKEKIKEQKSTMERLADKEDSISVQQFLEAKEKLNVLFDQEESYWKQRAKLFWLAEGDGNTKFFHQSASARRKSNRIDYLVDDSDNRVETEEGMCEIVYNYFADLFAGDVSETAINSTESPRRITAEQNEILTEELAFDEFT